MTLSLYRSIFFRPTHSLIISSLLSFRMEQLPFPCTFISKVWSFDRYHYLLLFLMFWTILVCYKYLNTTETLQKVASLQQLVSTKNLLTVILLFELRASGSFKKCCILNIPLCMLCDTKRYIIDKRILVNFNYLYIYRLSPLLNRKIRQFC